MPKENEAKEKALSCKAFPQRVRDRIEWPKVSPRLRHFFTTILFIRWCPREVKFYSFLLFLFYGSINAQEISSIPIEILYGKQPLELGKTYIDDNHLNQLTVDRFKTYLTKIRLVNEGRTDSLNFADQLVDAEDSNSLQLLLTEEMRFTQGMLIFQVGVDSTVQVSKTRGGVLDPIHGMYWTWQTGYINWKLEGNKKLHEKYIFHLGGFRQPYPTQQLLMIPFDIKKEKLIIDLHHFLTNSQIDEGPIEIMSPGYKAQMFSQRTRGCFTKDEL